MTGFDYYNGKSSSSKVRFAGVFYGLFMQFLFINDPDIATIKAENIFKEHKTAFKTNLNEAFIFRKKFTSRSDLYEL
jgi:hypothetical protein